MTVPPISPNVLAEVLDELPPRLRRRLDAAVPGAAAWDVRVDGDTARAELDGATLTWQLTGGALTTGAGLRCDCLLAPKCLHRAVAVAAAEVTDAAETAEPEPAVEPEAVEVAEAGAAERDAARAVAEAVGRVLHDGVGGSGTVTRAELLRAVHAARLTGLHRIASGGLTVAAALVAAAAGDPAFHRAAVTAELTGLLLACHDLAGGHGDPLVLRGVARREYRPKGTARFTGLCTEPVLAANGYAGVVTHLVDADGALWTVPGVQPGGAERVRAAAAGPVTVGETGLSHERLGRAGLLLSSGTASADRRLGSGAGVRAVAAAGAAWTDEPAAGLWRVPLAEQVARAFRTAERPDGLRPSGDELLFLTVRVLGGAGPALRVRVLDAAGERTVDLVGGNGTAADNLALLAGLAGAELLVVARPDAGRPGTATALAVSGDAELLRLPSDRAGRVNLGLDVLTRANLPSWAPSEPLPPSDRGADRTPIQLLEHWVERVAVGGRVMAAVASAETDRARLRRLGLTGTADVLGALASTARDQHRDPFGRLVTGDPAAFPTAWLRAGLYLRTFHRSVAEHSWAADELPET